MTDRVGPPAGWDADEATERIRTVTHAYPEHKKWLEEKDEKGNYVNNCGRCGRVRDRER